MELIGDVKTVMICLAVFDTDHECEGRTDSTGGRNGRNV